MGLAGFFALYVKFVDKPISQRVESYKAQIRRSEAQLRDLEVKRPQDVELNEKIKILKEDEMNLTNQISEIEKSIPSRLYTSQLVGELTSLAVKVKLESIKQNIAKEQNYSRIFLEVKFYGTFTDAVSYVSSIESISPFIRVEEMEILEPVEKTVELGGAPMKLVISCLLTDSAQMPPLKASSTAGLEVKRDILVSSSKPASEMNDEKFILEGVTFDPKNPTAIINGDVFQVNSEIGGYKVKKILADGVILSDGVEDHMLSLKAVVEKVK